MPGLLDIAHSTKTVSIGNVDVAVYGVSARGIAYLLERFPIFREFFTGRAAEVTAETIVQLVPDAIAAIIAAGTGSPGDKAAEEVAERLPASDQAELLQAIFTLTMPKGAGPFVESLLALAATLDGAHMSIPGTKSPQQSST